MNEAQRGAETGGTEWGVGIANWGGEPDETWTTTDTSMWEEPRREPPQRESRAATEQQERPQWRGSIFRNTIGDRTAEELRAHQALTTQSTTTGTRQREDVAAGSTALVTRLREAGVDAMFRRDEDVPWEVRCALEDLLFQVGQKDSEIAHLKRRTEAMAKATKVRHREDEQEGPPSKRRKYAGTTGC